MAALGRGAKFGHDANVPDDDLFRDAIVRLLGASPKSPDDLVAALVGADPSLGSVSSVRRRVDRALQFDTSLAVLTDGVVHVPTLVDATTWTVWIDGGDAAEGFVRMHPHLAVLGWWLIGGDVGLVDDAGGAIGTLTTDGLWLDDRDTDVVFGPDGWLDELADGWAEVTVIDGSLRWTRCAKPPSATDRQCAAVRAGFERAIRAEDAVLFDGEAAPPRFVPGDGPMHEALLIDRAAFVDDPVPHLPALYAAAGLEEQRGIVAEAGFDWHALRSWQERNMARIDYGLTPVQVDHLTLLIGAGELHVETGADALGPDEDQRDRGARLLSALLEDGDVATAFWVEASRRGRSVDELGRFMDELASRMEEMPLSGLAWVRARCLDLSGDATGAAELLASVVDGRCEHEPALVEAAGFASDRGDAPTAYRLLRQAGVVQPVRPNDDFDDDPSEGERLVREVEGFALHRPRATAGRNEPCPCGSGRKYKACHLGREQHSLADRSAWLYDKAQRYLHSRDVDVVRDLADTMTAESPHLRRQMERSPFVADMALHEAGLFDEFLTSRRALLPADESILAAQWTLVDRSVFEITATEHDRLDLYDIGRGERLTVVNTYASSHTRIGTVMVGRPLPVGDVYRAFGGFIGLPRAIVNLMLDAIHDGDPDVIAEVLASTFRPPRVQNTDGHDLVLRTLRWRVPEPGQLNDALVAAGFGTDDQTSWRLERATENNFNTIAATLTLSGTDLIGEVNSDERAEMLIDMIRTVLPALELIDDRTRSVEQAFAEHQPQDASAGLSADEPVVRELLATFVAEQERKWIDESIPALGGRTPREAVVDPIGREQVRQLLDSFPEVSGDDVGAMSPRRLRSLLDLEQC